MLGNANFELITNRVEDELVSNRHVAQIIHRENSIADNQMTLQNCVSLNEPGRVWIENQNQFSFLIHQINEVIYSHGR